jgi:hypothetical protein
MKMATKFVLLALLCVSGCTSKIDSKLDELAAKPAATTIEGARALYTEANDFVRWFDDPAHGKLSPAQLTKAQALRDKRQAELVKVTKDTVTSGISNVLGGIGVSLPSIDVGKTKDWFLGVGNPKVDKFTVPGRAPLDKRGAKDWP